MDVGCGVGEFRLYLLSDGYKGEYVGFDIVEPFIDYCRQNISGTFENRNLITSPPRSKYDCLIATQVFNSNFPNCSNLEVIRKLFEWSRSHIKKAVSVDFLSNKCGFYEDHLFFYSPEEMLELAQEYGDATLYEGYAASWEFCIQVRMREAKQS